MKKVFVCSPYAGDIDLNAKMAAEYCRIEMIQGNVPFAPHLHNTRFLNESNPLDREMGIRLGLEMLKICDELHVYGDRISNGMAREIAVWKEMGRTPIRCSVGLLLKKEEMV